MRAGVLPVRAGALPPGGRGLAVCWRMDRLVPLLVALARLARHMGLLLWRVATLRPPVQQLPRSWVAPGLTGALAIATGVLRWTLLDHQPLAATVLLGAVGIAAIGAAAWGRAQEGWQVLAACWNLCLAWCDLLAVGLGLWHGLSQGELWLPMLGATLFYLVVCGWRFDRLPPRVRRFSGDEGG